MRLAVCGLWRAPGSGGGRLEPEGLFVAGQVDPDEGGQFSELDLDPPGCGYRGERRPRAPGTARTRRPSLPAQIGPDRDDTVFHGTPCRGPGLRCRCRVHSDREATYR